MGETTVVDELRREMWASGVTLEDVAQSVGRSVATVSKQLSGKLRLKPTVSCAVRGLVRERTRAVVLMRGAADEIRGLAATSDIDCGRRVLLTDMAAAVDAAADEAMKRLQGDSRNIGPISTRRQTYADL